jgi:hypothetical protein
LTTTAGYDAPAVPNDSTYFLRVSTRDNLNHESLPTTLFVLKYTTTPPTLALAINNGTLTAYQSDVVLNLNTVSAVSPPKLMRFSNDGQNWSAWQPYADTATWTLPAADNTTLTVYGQVQDEAGNLAALSDAILLSLHPPLPYSANYRLCARTVNTAGGFEGSASYTLTSVLGEAGLGTSTSANYTHTAGLLVSVSDCWLPITTTVGYTMTQNVVANGGQIRGSTAYRVGDTLGQPVGTVLTSTSYQFASGFWAAITGTVPATMTQATPVPTLPPTPTPTPGPTPTPQPTNFSIVVNGGAPYTNNSIVTVRAAGPNVSQMRVSNGSSYANDNWQTYQLTTTWTLSTSNGLQATSSLQLIYAWFRNAQGQVYGTYVAAISYDPVPPQGSITILGNDDITTTNTIALWLEAYDDYSGVDQMRISADPTFTSAAWQPYTNVVTIPSTNLLLYAQFRDKAGNLSPIYDTNGNIYNPNARRIYLPLIVR